MPLQQMRLLHILHILFSFLFFSLYHPLKAIPPITVLVGLDRLGRYIYSLNTLRNIVKCNLRRLYGFHMYFFKIPGQRERVGAT